MTAFRECRAGTAAPHQLDCGAYTVRVQFPQDDINFFEDQIEDRGEYPTEREALLEANRIIDHLQRRADKVNTHRARKARATAKIPVQRLNGHLNGSGVSNA